MLFLEVSGHFALEYLRDFAQIDVSAGNNTHHISSACKAGGGS